ncbi:MULTISPECIES: ATP-binding protein [Photorhabdus]|uniref:ATP-binding protein n=1 Tax=Photorhabdus TaxID=29487 RepID=UPI0021D4EB24|nr:MULTISPECIES: ATP-binding protein [Photorhabdus]MCT8351896.1 ATP-binding protein [Photorhabdus kayaii]MDB6367061.1 ATP-binding protein [Photorhabdus bodei]
MTSIGLRFDGRIIDELSIKIPSNIFALNELTKNSYDAFSRKIDIKIDTQKCLLTISDDGLGMDYEDVKKLLHIANSSKKYGNKKKYDGLERYVQGSKGLGFLSVFKFGEIVSWQTHKNGKRTSFSIKKEDLVSKSNVSNYRVIPTVTDSSDKGTKIEINMDEEQIEALVDYFKDEKNSKKTVNAFYDNTVKIVIDCVDGKYESKDANYFLDEEEDQQFCYVTYSSKDSKINIYRFGKLVETHDYNLSSNQYSLELDIMVYYFNSGGKKKISKLFYREPDDALSPLLYINNNLFNNYVIFDSNINRSKRSAESMSQMTGYVRLYSSHKDIEFNSDRTNFVENNLTRGIKKDILELNKEIQKISSKVKEKDKENFGYVRTGRTKPENKEITRNNSSEELKTAKINLKNSISRRYEIPSKQLNLNDFISSVIDSFGKEVDVGNINFKIDNVDSLSIISSINNECVKDVELSYIDPKTGIVIEKLKLEFYLPKAIISGSSKKDLFTLASNKRYNLRIPYVTNLVNQLSEIYKSKNDYYEVIACSLRAILELSCDYLEQEFPNIFSHKLPINKDYNDKLLKKVVQVIHFLKNNNNVLTDVSKALGMSYQSLNNFMDIDSYKNAIKKAHLGAHKTVVFLPPDDVKALAHRTGHFAMYCDALLYKVDKDKVKNGVILSFPN